MAISPKEAKAREATAARKAIHDHEINIDRMLGEGRRAYSIVRMTAIAIKEIKTHYRALGWKVTLILCQRDGNYLEFEE